MTVKEQTHKKKRGREGFLRIDHTFFFKQIDRVIENLSGEFEQLMRSWTTFHLLFFLLGSLQIALFFIFFRTLAESSLLAGLLGLMLFTLFSFFTLRLYYLNKRPEQLKKIQGKFLRSCKQLLAYREDIPQHHIAVANACNKFSSALKVKKYQPLLLPRFFPSLSIKLQEWSRWWHFDDVHSLKELLLEEAVNEHIKLVKCEPTSLEAHAALANAYVILSSLYVWSPAHEEGGWIPSSQKERHEIKFRDTAKRAIEEFKVLNDFAPDDPWIHAQLAYSYHDLHMPKEEIREYETIIQLCPWDKDTLFKLGILYFQQGQTSKGLSIYEKLKRSNYKRADILLDYYGSQ